MPRPPIALAAARPLISAVVALVLAAGALPSPVGAAAPTPAVLEAPALEVAGPTVRPTRASEAPPADRRRRDP